MRFLCGRPRHAARRGELSALDCLDGQQCRIIPTALRLACDQAMTRMFVVSHFRRSYFCFAFRQCAGLSRRAGSSDSTGPKNPPILRLARRAIVSWAGTGRKSFTSMIVAPGTRLSAKSGVFPKSLRRSAIAQRSTVHVGGSRQLAVTLLFSKQECRKGCKTIE